MCYGLVRMPRPALIWSALYLALVSQKILGMSFTRDVEEHFLTSRGCCMGVCTRQVVVPLLTFVLGSPLETNLSRTSSRSSVTSPATPGATPISGQSLLVRVCECYCVIVLFSSLVIKPSHNSVKLFLDCPGQHHLKLLIICSLIYLANKLSQYLPTWY